MTHPSIPPLPDADRAERHGAACGHPDLRPLCDGVVEHASPHFVGVRTRDGYRLVHAGSLDGPLCDSWVRS
jgi:hypothetical protein